MTLFPLSNSVDLLREVSGEADPDALAERLIAALHRLFPGRDIVVTDVQLEHSRAITDRLPDSSADTAAPAKLPAPQSSSSIDQSGRVRLEYRHSPFPAESPAAADYRLVLDLHTIPTHALNEPPSGEVTADGVLPRQIQVVATLQHALTISGQAIICLTPDGHIEFLSGSALQILRRYFGSPADPTTLPGPLRQWIAQQRETPRQPEAAPLLVQNAAGRLTVHRTTLDGRTQYLLLHEDLAAPALADFTPRERDVLRLLATGAAQAAIATHLALSTATVRNHLSRIYRKLGAHNQAEAAKRARCILEGPVGQSVRRTEESDV